MPCDSSYMEPTWREAASARITELLREARGQKFNHEKPRLYYGDVAHFDRDVKALCDWCREHDVSGKSLEMQIWWRDHQKIEAARKQEAATATVLKTVKARALKKLSTQERAALHLEDEL